MAGGRGGFPRGRWLRAGRLAFGAVLCHGCGGGGEERRGAATRGGTRAKGEFPRRGRGPSAKRPEGVTLRAFAVSSRPGLRGPRPPTGRMEGGQDGRARCRGAARAWRGPSPQPGCREGELRPGVGGGCTPGVPLTPGPFPDGLVLLALCDRSHEVVTRRYRGGCNRSGLSARVLCPWNFLKLLTLSICLAPCFAKLL